MTVEFHLPDMSCQHCVRVVTEAVVKADHSAVLSIDLDARRVKIDSPRPAQIFAEALAAAGYPPR
jgi:copper chaperone